MAKYKESRIVRQDIRRTLEKLPTVAEGLVVEELVGDREQDWLFENHGGGVTLDESPLPRTRKICQVGRPFVATLPIRI
jgi:hypothetical protein